MNNYDKDPAAGKEFGRFWKLHLEINKMRGTDGYADAADAFRDHLRGLVTNTYLLGCLSGKQLLRLGHMQNRYRPVAPHQFHMFLSMAVEAHEPNV